jgi:catechol 2,3-dioxygenase-like lactoylglutathione lyase family enzyme
MSRNDRRNELQTGHVGLNVSDLDRSKSFYQDVFGFTVAAESKVEGRRFALLKDEERLVLTLWQQSEGRFDKGRPGLHHLSFQATSRDEVEKIERRLRAIGAMLIYDGLVPHGEGTESGGIFFEDPDGIRLEVFTATGGTGGDVPTPGAPSCGFF